METDISQKLYSQHVEQSILGAVILDPSASKSINIETGDFYNRKHQMIWEAVDSILRDNGCPDYIAVCSQLDRTGHLKDIGGIAYITHLINSVTTTLALKTWVATMRDLSRRRNVLSVVNKLAQDVYGDTQLDEAVASAFEKMMKNASAEEGALPISYFASQYYDFVDARQRNPSKIAGLSTGLLDLDALLGGIEPQELIMISGDPGLGKSLLAYQICAHMAANKHPGAIYELEMSGKKVVGRHVACRAGIQTDIMTRGKIKDDDWASFTDAIEYISGLPIFMSDSPNWTTTGIRADCTRLKASHKIDWVMVDYLTLLKDKPNSPEWERTSECTGRLHDLAKSLDVAVICINSLNKAGMDNGNDPKSSDVRGGGGVPSDADKIIFVVKDKENEHFRRIIPTKKRENDDLRGIRLYKKVGFPAFECVENNLPKPKREPIN